MTAPSLEQLISRQISADSPEAVERLGVVLRQRYGDSVDAILYYGSCLRQGDALEGVVDLYRGCSSYRAALASAWRSLIYFILPPTVKYMEVEIDGAVARTKYALISRRDFRRGTSQRWFHSYLWGRFSQPCQLVFAANECNAGILSSTAWLARYAHCSHVPPRSCRHSSMRATMERGSEPSYRSELRPESGTRGIELADSSAQYYSEITVSAAGATGIRVSPGRPVSSQL